MSEINVQLNDGAQAQLEAPVTVAEALKRLDREAAKKALAARVNGREVDLGFTLGAEANGHCAGLKIVELPDDVNWQIERNGGVEHVSEVHRTWR